MAELSGATLQALQMLMAGGQDIAQGTGGTNLGAAVQGNIQSRSMLKLLQTLLGPDGTKATFSNTGMNLTIPKETEMFKSLLGEGGNLSPDMSLAPKVPSATPNPLPSNYSIGGGGSFINPFVEGQPESSGIPSISGADLAGLTAKDISIALGLKQAQDQLKQQSYRDLVEATYKGSVIKREEKTAEVMERYHNTLIKKAEADIENDKPIYKTDQGLLLNAKDYLAYQKIIKEDQPAAIKVYEYAKTPAGGGFTGTLAEFQDSAKTGHMKDYEAAVKDGYPPGKFNQWLQESIKNGSINLGDLWKKEELLNKFQLKKYFANPDWTKDLQGYIGSKEVQNRLYDISVPDLGPNATKEQKQKAYKDAIAHETAKENIKFIEGKIAAGGGKILDITMDKDGKTITWKVKDPTGDIIDVTQAVR